MKHKDKFTKKQQQYIKFTTENHSFKKISKVYEDISIDKEAILFCNEFKKKYEVKIHLDYINLDINILPLLDEIQSDENKVEYFKWFIELSQYMMGIKFMWMHESIYRNHVQRKHIPYNKEVIMFLNHGLYNIGTNEYGYECDYNCKFCREKSNNLKLQSE